MADGKVDWFENDVLIAIDRATDEILSELAFFVEGEAKTRMTVDTGFMRNATYAITPLASRRIKAEAEARAAADREMAPEPQLESGQAAVHAAAEYTLYQELAQPALYPALEKARGVAGGTIQEVARKRGLA